MNAGKPIMVNRLPRQRRDAQGYPPPPTASATPLGAARPSQEAGAGVDPSGSAELREAMRALEVAQLAVDAAAERMGDECMRVEERTLYGVRSVLAQHLQTVGAIRDRLLS